MKLTHIALAAITAGVAFVAAPEAEAAPREGLRAAQYELCDAGNFYRQDVANGWMNWKQAKQEAVLYAVDIANENGWGKEVSSTLANAAAHGMEGGNCGIYR